MSSLGRRLLQVIAVAAILAGCSSTPESVSPDRGPTSSTPGMTATAPASTAPTPTTSRLPATPAGCDAGPAVDPPAAVVDLALEEISGVASGRRSGNHDILWVVDDNAVPPTVHGLAPDGTTVIRVELDIEGRDWEDLAIGPGPDGTPHLHVADIGDNEATRDSVRVLRFPEPGSTGAVSLTPDIITLTYPDGPRDAESLAVDPLTGDLLIVAKDRILGPQGVYRAPAPPAGDSSAVLERVYDLDVIGLRAATPLPLDLGAVALGGFFPTALDISADGSVVALRTYEAVWLFPRQPDQPAWTALAAEPCEAASVVESQGEAMTLTATGHVTISEGPNPAINRFESSPG